MFPYAIALYDNTSPGNSIGRYLYWIERGKNAIARLDLNLSRNSSNFLRFLNIKSYSLANVSVTREIIGL